MIAAATTFALLLRALMGDPPARQLSLVFPFLGGLLLVSAHWSMALALAAVGIALVAGECFGVGRQGSA
jgi:hypothetical protein